jgi:uncharacterized membrane protein
VVAVEYPRKGIWSIGLVTSDGMSDVVNAAREPCVTVVLPGSPTPVTGYCVMVPTRETHDLGMTIDQALQFYVSCGVAVPKSQHVDRQLAIPSAVATGPVLIENVQQEGRQSLEPVPSSEEMTRPQP